MEGDPLHYRERSYIQFYDIKTFLVILVLQGHLPL